MAVNLGVNKITMEIQELKRRAGIVENETVTECPDTDASVAAAAKKIQSVMKGLRYGPDSQRNQHMYSVLQSAIEDLESAEAESRANHAGDQR